MKTLPKGLRADLEARFSVERPRPLQDHTSRDGSRKWLFAFADGNEAECVFIPEDDRGALCVSTQVGCTLNCAFCHTGTQPLVRDLGAGEIVAQVLAARDAIGEWPTPKQGRLLSNIVVMGMGEPLLNYDNVARALRIVMDGDGIGISKRRITLSTSGIVPMMRRCGEDLGVKLAVSLHATTDALRDRLVPINRKYPIAELLAACRDYPGANNARRITFEYVLLAGVNDSAADAHRLVGLTRGIAAKFNLIPFNPWPGAAYACSGPAAMKRFAAILNDAGYSAPIRVPRGRDIMAACGQLRSASRRPERAPAAAAMAVR
jgi:23S rRNA (adenine2503-C2)-methyltransferase